MICSVKFSSLCVLSQGSTYFCTGGGALIPHLCDLIMCIITHFTQIYQQFGLFLLLHTYVWMFFPLVPPTKFTNKILIFYSELKQMSRFVIAICFHKQNECYSSGFVCAWSLYLNLWVHVPGALGLYTRFAEGSAELWRSKFFGCVLCWKFENKIFCRPEGLESDLKTFSVMTWTSHWSWY